MTGVKKKRENWLPVYVIFILLLIVMIIVSPDFRSTTNIRNLIVQLTPLGLLTIGQALVLITGGIDLSVGTVMSFGTVLVATQMNQIGVFSSILLIVIIGIIIGAINGSLVSFLGMNPFITTIGTMTLVKGLTLWVSPAPGGMVPYTFSNVVMYTELLGLPVFCWIFFLIYLIMCIILYKTKYGRHLYAVGGNPDAAFLAGINVNRTVIVSYIFSSMLAIVGGILMSARISCGDPLVGDPFQLETIGSAVMGGVSLAGGRGGLIGALGGVLIFGGIANMLNMLSVSPYWQFIIKSIIVICAIAFAIKSQQIEVAGQNDK